MVIKANEILDANKEEVIEIANNAYIWTEALEEAEIKDEIKLLLRQLSKKFKVLPKQYEDKIKILSAEKIELIANDIFDIDSIEELNKYLN